MASLAMVLLLDGYMIMLSAVVKWCCCCSWRALTHTANPGESRLYTARDGHRQRAIDRQALAMLAVKGACVVYCTFLQYAHTFIPVFQLSLIPSAGIGLICLNKFIPVFQLTLKRGNKVELFINVN
jgi:hypothetical protein